MCEWRFTNTQSLISLQNGDPANSQRIPIEDMYGMVRVEKDSK